jgi:hypothetical protein
MKIKHNGKTWNVKIGGDAEFFLKKDGVVFPASEVIPGTKEKPHTLENGVCHPDGLSLEVGFPPADTPREFLCNILKVIQEVRLKYLDPNGVQFTDESEVQISGIKAAEKDFERGCSSENFAWGAHGEAIKQLDTTADTHRFSGFHIHLGFTKGQTGTPTQVQDMAILARVMDGFVMKHRLFTTDLRSKQYGGYGAFRVKPYGIEYRAMDSSVFLQRAKLKSLMAFLDDIPEMFKAACTHGKKQFTMKPTHTSQDDDLRKRVRSVYMEVKHAS